MQLAEPMTMATDYLLAVLCAVCAWKLLRRGSRLESRAMISLAGSFAATAVAALAGGSTHGFGRILPAPAPQLLWKTTVVAIGVSVYLLVRAAARAGLQGRARRWVVALSGIQLFVYLAWMVRHDAFLWVVLDAVPAMLLVLAIEVLDWRRGQPWAGALGAGIVVSLAGALLQQSGWDLHPRFNHNDLYHVVQMGAAVLLYRGGRQLRDR